MKQEVDSILMHSVNDSADMFEVTDSILMHSLNDSADVFEVTDSIFLSDIFSVNHDSLEFIEPTDSLVSCTSLDDTTVLMNKPLPVRPRSEVGSEWIFGVLILTYLLFASVKLVFNKYLINLFQAVVNFQTSSRMFREKNYKFLHGAYRLNLIFYLVGGLFAFQYVQQYLPPSDSENEIRLYFICLGALSAYYSLKFLFLYGLGILMNIKNEMLEFIFNISVYNKVLGIALVVVSSCIAFFPVEIQNIWMTIGIIMIIVVYLLYLIRGGAIFIKRHFSILYMILYLCTLEILPLLLIYKVLLG